MSPAHGAPEVRLLAPAKLNLGLRVVGRRADGYHEIESLFVPIDLADELRLAIEPDGAGVDFTLEPTPAGVPADATNLAARAAAAFLAECGEACRVRVRLRKRIPPGAGLGGGSSDAGAVLRGLAAQLPGRLDAARLARVALGLGADVPFFLAPRPALVRGIGERIEPLAGLAPLHFVLAMPGPPLATADVYRAFDGSGAGLTPAGEIFTIRTLSELQQPGRLRAAGWTRLLTNDLEPVARRLRPAIGTLLDAVRGSGALAAGMSGSGPTVFGVFEQAVAAQEAREQLRSGAEVWTQVAAALESVTP